MADKAMDLDTIRSRMQAMPGAMDDMPFGPDVIVYKVMGKVFGLIAWKDLPIRINLKCDPGLALMHREIYEAVIPGYHMNKKHWNTVILDGSLDGELVQSMINHSYELVVKGLRKSDREALKRKPAMDAL